MTECPSCGTVHEGQPRFCGGCGYQFASAPSTLALKKCPDCAEDVRAEARKCRFCGFEFSSEKTQLVEEQQGPVEESQGPARPEMKPHWKGLIALTLLLCVLIWGAYVKSVDRATRSDTSSVGSSAVPSTTTASVDGTTRESKVMLYMSCLGLSPSAAARALKAADGDPDKVLTMTHMAVSGDLSGRAPLNDREKTCLKSSGLQSPN